MKPLLASLFFLAFAVAAAPIPGEIAHYPLQDGVGTIAKEAANRLPPIQIKRSFWTTKDGVPLIDFGGMKKSREAYAELPPVDFDGEFTIAFWVSAYWWKENWAPLVYRSDATYGIRCNRNHPGQLHFRVKDPGSKRGINLMSNAVLDQNHWYHVAAVFKPGEYMRIFIDGALDNEATLNIPKTIAADKNRFRLGGSGRDNYFAGVLCNLHLYKRALDADEIAQLRASENRYDLGADAALPESGPVACTLQGRVAIHQAGGMTVAVGDAKYRLDSLYSYPATPAMGFNHLAADAVKGGEAAWKPAVSADGSTARITARGASLRLTRTVTVLEDGRIRIQDTFQNPTKEDQAVLFEHRLSSAQPVAQWTLHGVDQARSPGDARQPSANPTGFFSQGKSSLGWVVEDDIFRCHLSAAVRDLKGGRRLFSFGSRRIGVPAGKSHTLEFTLYPCASPDYYDFLNRLRRDWQVPLVTLPGPFGSLRTAAQRSEVFRRLAADPAAMKREFETRNMRVITLNPWFHYWDGAVFASNDDYKRHMQKVMPIIRAANPEAKFLASLETYTYCLQDEDFGVPAPEGFSWETITPGTAARLKASPWVDSTHVNPAGKFSLYPMSAFEGRRVPSLPLSVYPALGNHFFKVRLKEFDFLLDEVGLDGIYQDMFGFSAPTNLLRDRWDGFTVSANPQGRIEKRFTHLGPLTAKARAVWLRHILGKGKLALTNFGAPTTRELQTIPYMNFCEAAGRGVGHQDLKSIPPDASGVSMNQLSTPLGYGPHRVEEIDPVAVMARVRAYLRYGCLYVHTSVRNRFPEGQGGYGPVNHSFPITPVELHRGWVKGKERIVSCVSCTTTWDKPAKPVVLRFDAIGNPVPAGDAATITGRPGAWDITVKIDDWKEFCILE